MNKVAEGGTDEDELDFGIASFANERSMNDARRKQGMCAESPSPTRPGAKQHAEKKRANKRKAQAMRTADRKASKGLGTRKKKIRKGNQHIPGGEIAYLR